MMVQLSSSSRRQGTHSWIHTNDDQLCHHPPPPSDNGCSSDAGDEPLEDDSHSTTTIPAANINKRDERAETASLSDSSSSPRRIEDDGLDDDDDDDQQQQPTTTTTTERQAFVHLLKGYVGPGCLSLPWAVSQLGGIPMGCAAIALVAVWTSYNCWTVVELKLRYVIVCRSEDLPQPPTNTNNTYNNSRAPIHITYPGLARWLWGPWAEVLLAAAVCVQQLAVGTVFLSFLGTNLQAVLQEIRMLSSLSVNHVTVITAALPAVMALSCVSDLKALAPFIGVATVLLLLGLTLLMCLVVLEWGDRSDDDENDYNNNHANKNNDSVAAETQSWASWPLAICAILYSFEGVCLILPVQGSMQRPQNFAPVFGAAMTAAALIFGLVAALSVAAFGKVTSGSITAFLLEKYGGAVDHHENNDTDDDNNNNIRRWLVVLANAVVSISVLLTYPLQLFPCFELVGPPTALLWWLWGACRRRRTHHHRSDHVQLTTTTRTTDTRNGSNIDYFAPVPADSSDNDDDDLPFSHHHPADELDSNDGEHYSPEEEQQPPQPQSSSADTPMGRVGLVLLTYILAIAVPNVESMISLAGALAGSLVALLVPPAMRICYHRNKHNVWGQSTSSDPPDNCRGMIGSYLLFAAGLVFLVIGTTASLIDIVKIYEGK